MVVELIKWFKDAIYPSMISEKSESRLVLAHRSLNSGGKAVDCWIGVNLRLKT